MSSGDDEVDRINRGLPRYPRCVNLSGNNPEVMREQPAYRRMSELVEEFEARLTGRYGEFVPPSALWKELGFATAASFRKALSQARVEVEVFDIAGRRGSFARALDVARWQATVYSSRRRHAKQ